MPEGDAEREDEGLPDELKGQDWLDDATGDDDSEDE